jgi:hypothetical protein
MKIRRRRVASPATQTDLIHNWMRSDVRVKAPSLLLAESGQAKTWANEGVQRLPSTRTACNGLMQIMITSTAAEMIRMHVRVGRGGCTGELLQSDWAIELLVASMRGRR